MARTPAQPIEIAVKATLDNPFVTIRWSFVRMQVHHKFEAVVVQDDKDKSLAFRDNAFTMSYPISMNQREEFRRKHPRAEVPTQTVKKIAVNAPSYKDMIGSLRILLKDKPVIEDARTSRTNTASVRFAEFVYPKWYRKRTGVAYKPPERRGALALPSPVNGADAAETPIMAIIEKFTPLSEVKTYEQGVGAAYSIVERMRIEIVTMGDAAANNEGKAIFSGYAAMLMEVQNRLNKLLA
jgi:hypothetical protein